MEKEMRIEAYTSGQKPDLEMLARHLLPKIRQAAENPEILRAYEEWKRKREEARNVQ